MPVTVLYPEARQRPDDLEAGVFGPDIRIVKRDAQAMSQLSDADCAEVDGLMIGGFKVTGADMARFPRLRTIVRTGVGYDNLDRPAAATRNILICNVPDYGTTEVADHAIALALTLRRGILLHHELQRADPPAPFRSFQHPLIQRLGSQTFGIIGLGRIGTAVALRARALLFRVVFYDPYLPNGAELALGIERARSLDDLLRETDTLTAEVSRLKEEVTTGERNLVVLHDTLERTRNQSASATREVPSTFCSKGLGPSGSSIACFRAKRGSAKGERICSAGGPSMTRASSGASKAHIVSPYSKP
jgi:C-terminal binding protein